MTEINNVNIYGTFNRSIARVKALIDLQDGITIYLDNNYDYSKYILHQLAESDSFYRFYRSMKEILNEMFEEYKENHPEKISEFREQTKYIDTSENRKLLRNSFTPLIKTFEASEMVYEKPLYYEAVISSVTAFETYIKDTMESIKLHRRGLKKILEIPRNISNFEKVNNFFRIAFEVQRSEGFSIFSSDRQEERLRKFLLIRNLIVHKSGLIDDDFYAKTRCKFKKGDLYPLKRKFLLDRIGAMKNIVSRIENIMIEEYS